MPTRDPTRPPPSLQKQFLRACRAAGKRLKVADSLGTRLTGHELLVRVLAVRALLERTLAPDERMVGVMLPPTAGAAVVNAAIALSGRVSVNLNYTCTQPILDVCIERGCGT